MAGSFSDYQGVKAAPKGSFSDYRPPEPPFAFESSMRTVGKLFAGAGPAGLAAGAVVAAPEETGAFLAGAKRGMESIAEGGVQSALQLGSLATGIDSKAPQDALERLRAERIGEYQPSADRFPVASGIGEIAGGGAAGAITTGAVAAAGTALGAPAMIASTVGKAAAGVLGSGLSGAALTYGTPEEKLIAGGISAALSLGSKLLSGGAPSAAKTLVGNVDDVKARVDNAGKLGQTLTVGQALDSPSIQTVEKGLAEVPIVGTKGAFNRQLAGAKDASTKVVEGLNTVSKESVDDAYKAFHTVAANSEKPMPLTNLQTAIQDISAKLKVGNTDFKKMTGSRLREFLDNLPAEQELKPTEISNLQEVFGTVFDGIKKDDTRNLARAETLKKAFDADHEAYAKSFSSNIYDLFGKAKDLHKSRMNGEMLQGMLDDAVNPTSGKLDPLALTRSLAKSSDKLEKSLHPKDFQVVKGLQTYLQSINQGVSIGKAQSFGLKSLVLGLAGTASYLNPLHAAAIGTAGKAASAALTSPKVAPHVVNLLTKLASTKASSPLSGALKRAITRGLTVETAKQAVED